MPVAKPVNGQAQPESPSVSSDVDPLKPIKPSNMEDAEFKKVLDTLKNHENQIYNTFLSVEAPHEVNLNSKIKKPLMEHHIKASLHPDIYNAAFDHILIMLQNDHFRKFMIIAKTQPVVKAPPASAVQEKEEPALRVRASISDKMKGFFGKKK